VVTNEGVKPGTHKIQGINEFPIPYNKTDVKSFLVLTRYYSKLFHNLAKLQND